ncbi:MAG: PPC domain-containing protein [Planctomycetota bacterium]|nr:PPC domain-containing protein [Planctomycetota bacterium]
MRRTPPGERGASAPCRPPRRSLESLLYALVLSCGIGPIVHAQQVPTEPASTHIFPAGGRRGTSVPVRVGGEFLPPFTRFRLVGEGVAAPPELTESAVAHFESSPRRKPGGTPINYPREWSSEITIAADAPLGQTLWRVASARGGSGGRPFLVGDLPEFIESESNSTPDKAELITLPVTVNGQIAGERDHDYYRFVVEAGSVVSVDVAAGRLGSPLDPVVELTDPDGRRVSVVELRRGSDPVLAFRAPVRGEYRLLISNLNFRGGPQYVYRVTLSTDPYIVAPFPAGGLAGSTADIELLSLTDSTRLVARTVSIPFPADARRDFLFPGTIPTANRFLLESTAVPTPVEREPNDSVETATAVLVDTIAFGRFSSPTDTDWYSFKATAGQALTLECQGIPQGAGSLPLVTVCDASGNPLAKANAIELFPRPCRVEWRAPADGTWFIQVRDVGRGASESVYRLTLRPTQPEFSLTAATDIVNVVQGNRGEIDLKIDRQGGLTGPIDLKIDGLPEGVRCEPAQIPANVDSFKLAVIAIDDTRPGDSVLNITGMAKHGEETITRSATATHLGHDLEGVSVGSPTTDHLQLTLRHKQVFRLFCSEAYQYAHRGTIYPYLMEVERMNGFEGAISIQMGDRQIMDHDGAQVVDAVFPAGTSQIMLPLYMPESMHINIQPHSNIYSQGYVVFNDKWGQRQSMVQVSEMRCMIRPLPTVARLRSREKSLSIRPGESATVTLQLDRTTNFTGPMTVELVSAIEGVRMTPVEIPAGQSLTVATLVVEPGCVLPAQSQLTFRGVGELPGNVKVVSLVELPVVGATGR